LALLDVNSLVALAWDSHVHHARIREWFERNRDHGWATCPVTEAGFVRISSNRKALPHPVGVATARSVLTLMTERGAHRFLANDISMRDPDLPPIAGHRQVTDAMLLALARRSEIRLVTFDAGIATLGDPREVELLRP